MAVTGAGGAGRRDPAYRRRRGLCSLPRKFLAPGLISQPTMAGQNLHIGDYIDCINLQYRIHALGVGGCECCRPDAAWAAGLRTSDQLVCLVRDRIHLHARTTLLGISRCTQQGCLCSTAARQEGPSRFRLVPASYFYPTLSQKPPDNTTVTSAYSKGHIQASTRPTPIVSNQHQVSDQSQ